ncbi:hypothetical protein [Aquimarina sp. 2304DJ70-9]|uniref:hypothetical protein n=1 Tax=Aquimarina penaris TaxID=3231044 RepID=UPI003462CF9D
MSKSLHSLTLLVFLLIFNFISSQSSFADNHFSHKTDIFYSTDVESNLEDSHTTSNKKVFSYIFKTEDAHLDHDHNDDLSLLDVISSDESSDFNCSGGFCMNKLHFHKKGLTIKKQLFVYFMRISC